MEPAGRKKGNGATGHGNHYLARVLGEAAVSAGRTHTFLGERYRRIARRRGKKRAIIAVGRSILVIIWQGGRFWERWVLPFKKPIGLAIFASWA